MKIVYIGGGYRVSDADAGKLARAVGRRLPPFGFLLNVVMPHGEPAMLARTSLPGPHERLHGEKLPFRRPRRGWVWFVTSSSHDLSRYTKASAPLRRAALMKAKRAAQHASDLEEKRAWAWAEKPLSVKFDEEGAREAADAYLVAADAYEEAGDMLLAMRHRADAERLLRLFAGGEGRPREVPRLSRAPASRTPAFRDTLVMRTRRAGR